MTHCSRQAVLLLMFTALLAYALPAIPQARGDSSAHEIDVVDAQVQRIWGLFVDRLKAGDVDGAIRLVSPGSRSKYESAFRQLGEDLRELPAGWSRPEVVSVSRPFAEYFLSQTYQGQERGHLILFVQDSNGQWFIDSL